VYTRFTAAIFPSSASHATDGEHHDTRALGAEAVFQDAGQLLRGNARFVVSLHNGPQTGIVARLGANVEVLAKILDVLADVFWWFAGATVVMGEKTST